VVDVIIAVDLKVSSDAAVVPVALIGEEVPFISGCELTSILGVV
jgi:hypothetical protein